MEGFSQNSWVGVVSVVFVCHNQWCVRVADVEVCGYDAHRDLGSISPPSHACYQWASGTTILRLAVASWLPHLNTGWSSVPLSFPHLIFYPDVKLVKEWRYWLLIPKCRPIIKVPSCASWLTENGSRFAQNIDKTKNALPSQYVPTSLSSQLS